MCAVAADSKKHKFFFIYIEEVVEMENEGSTEVEDASDSENEDGDNDDDDDENEDDPEVITDKHGHIIPAGCSYIRGRYLEHDKDMNRGKYKGVVYKLMRDPVVFYKETVVYPLVNYEWKGKKVFISNNSYCDVLAYTERFGMSSITTFAN